MKIEIIINSTIYECEKIPKQDIVAGTGIHYLFYGNDWYKISLTPKGKQPTIPEMREILGAAVAREWILFNRKGIDKIIRDLNDCKYQPDAYIKEWYTKFFES